MTKFKASVALDLSVLPDSCLSLSAAAKSPINWWAVMPYGTAFALPPMVGEEGIEPPTSCGVGLSAFAQAL